jgi:hypothetical protein
MRQSRDPKRELDESRAGGSVVTIILQSIQMPGLKFDIR